MNLFSRHKNTVVLATVLLAQFLALAVQVRRQTAEGPVRLIRLIAVTTLAPFERFFIYSGESVRGVWANYIDLRHVRSENLRMKAEFERMRLDRAREQEDARQARRIQALLGFKEQWIDATVAAQVIGTSGSETSRVLYLDKGTKDGIRADMPVITPDGVVGKVLTVYGETSQVLLINDPTSGVGATLVTSRLQGIVKGTATGELPHFRIVSIAVKVALLWTRSLALRSSIGFNKQCLLCISAEPLNDFQCDLPHSACNSHGECKLCHTRPRRRCRSGCAPGSQNPLPQHWRSL